MHPMIYILQQAINAVSLGSLYALVAVGLSMVFGILRMTNFAHGDMMMVGAFATMLLTVAGLPFGWAVVGGIVAGGLAGIIVERAAYRPVRGAPDVTLLLTSLGVTYILENLGILLFTSSPQNFPIPDWLNGSYQFLDGMVTFTQINLLTIGLTLVSLLALGWFVTRTDVGLGMRAAAEDMAAAHLVGLDVNRLIIVAFAIASGFAGLAGVLWAAQYQTIDSTAGTGYELTVISAVVVGGVAIFGGSGSAVGAAIGALLLSSINSALNVLGISSLWLEAISGFLLLVAITLDRVISVRLQAALRRRSAGVGT